MQNPSVALVTLVHRMAETVFSLYGRGNDVVKVHVHVTGDSTLAQDASDYANSPAAALLGEAETQWGDRLPGSPEALFQWLLTQDQVVLLDLLAYCTARSVNAIASRERGIDHTDALAGALGVCMSDWWKPTAASYFGRVSRAQALDAIKEATGNDESIALRKLKKGELAEHCADLFAQVRWVPQPLRARAAPKTARDMEQVAD
jgi:ParB family chromosome partitioning protein